MTPNNKMITPETAATISPSNLSISPEAAANVQDLPKVNRSRMSKLRQKLNGALVAAQVRMLSKKPIFNMRPLDKDEEMVTLIQTEKVYLEHYVAQIAGTDGGEESGQTAGFGVYTATGVTGGKFTGPVLRAFYYTEAKAQRRAREMDKKPYTRTKSADEVRRKCNVCLDPATHVEFMDQKKDPDYRRYLCEACAKKNTTPAMVFFNAQKSHPLPEGQQ